MKEHSSFDSPTFRKELDEYWAPASVRITQEEYDQLVADSTLLTWIHDYLLDMGIKVDLEKLTEFAKRSGV